MSPYAEALPEALFPQRALCSGHEVGQASRGSVEGEVGGYLPRLLVVVLGDVIAVEGDEDFNTDAAHLPILFAPLHELQAQARRSSPRPRLDARRLPALG
jgi:hypothetical protein